MNSVGIIGAGAAGIMAALAAAEAGADVSLFEKNNIVGKKMGITGKGRCNLTNAAPITDFIGSTQGGKGRSRISSIGQRRRSTQTPVF